MASKIWVPQSDDSIDGYLYAQPSGGGYYVNIDDTPADAAHPNGYDDMSTYVQHLYLTASGDSVFGLDMDGGVNESVPDGSTSISVMLYYRISTNNTPKQGQGYIYCGIKSSSTLSYTAQLTTANGVWESGSKAYSTNPNGGGAWTPATVNAITLITKGYGGAKSVSSLTQMYAVVTYTPPVATPRPGVVFHNNPGIV